MKSLWNSFKIAFAMFSKIPMPQADWSKENMKYMFCFFPFIGAVIGAFSLLAAKTGWYFGIGNGFLTVILVLIPVVITGGIHVDGLLDTSDALSSWRDREKRLEILKDSHAGAFAVITACAYFMAFYGGYSQINDNWKALCIMALGFCISRCLSGLGVLSLPKANASGTVAELSRKAEDRPVRITLIVYLIFLLAADVYIQPIWGISAFITALLVFVFYRYKAMKYFEGTTGDLAGYFLCLCEVWSVLILAVVTVVFP